MRFLRSYEIIVRTSEKEAFRIKQGDENGSFKEGLRVSFNSTKSIYSGLNNCTLRIFNLEPKKRESIVKYEEESNLYFQVQIRAGYVNDINLLFLGNVLNAYSFKDNVDYVTEINCFEGLFDFQNAYVSSTVKGDDKEFLKEAIKACKESELGGYTPTGTESVRGKTMIGRAYDVIHKHAIEKNKLFFVDKNKIFLLNFNEVVSTDAIKLTSDNILTTPTRKNLMVNVTVLMNPSIELGGLVQLESSFKQLNGFYRVETIRTNFDSDTGSCDQTLKLRLMNNYRRVNASR
jgi:hypothetical protein